MHALLILFAFAVVAVSALSRERPQLFPAQNVTQPLDKVAMSAIKVLTFNAGEMTAHRRVPAAKQLNCESGCQYGRLSKAECTNSGTDGRLPRWTCTAKLPRGVSFSRVDVSCEGYKHSQDTNVLVGSCALNYQLSRRSNSPGLGAFAVLAVVAFGCTVMFIAAIPVAFILKNDVPHRSQDDDDRERRAQHYHHHNSRPGYIDTILLYLFLDDCFGRRPDCSSSGWSSSSGSSGWPSKFGGTSLR